MKKNNLKRFLASLLAVLMLSQVTGVAPGVFADNSAKSISTYEATATPQLKTDAGTIKVTIKDGVDVQDALAQKLLSNYSELSKEQIAAIDWQYECEGKSPVGTKNTAWGSINGFTTQTGNLIKVNYDHPALIKQADQETFKVAIGNDHSKYCTIQKVAKEDSSIIPNANVSVKLAYNNDGTINYEGINEAVFNAAVKSSTPELTVNDVTITYEAKATSGSVGSLGKEWMPLGGGKKDLLTYPGVTEGTHKVKIEYSENDTYYGTAIELDINFLGREASAITFNENPVVKITYEEKDGNVAIKFDDLYAAIWNNVVAGTVPELSRKDVTIKYYATANSGSIGDQGKEWMPLEGGSAKWNGTVSLTYPAISEGNQKLRFEFAGNAYYTGFSEEVAVNFVGRDPAFEIIPGVTQVDMKFADATNYDYESTANAIREAVVKKLADDESIKLSDVTVEYNAAYVGTDFKSLDNKDIATKKLTADEEFTFRLSWVGESGNGTALYKPFSAEVKLTLVDNRIASEIKVVSDPSITYNMSGSVEKDAIVASVIDYTNSTLPTDAKFTVKVKKTTLGVDTWKDITENPMDAGENQDIRISFAGNAEYKPCTIEAAITVKKAPVSISLPLISKLYAGDEIKIDDYCTVTPDDPAIDVYLFFVGVNSNKEACVNFQLTDDQMAIIDNLSELQMKLFHVDEKDTIKCKLRDGMKLSEFKETIEKLPDIDKIEFVNNILTILNTMDTITDNTVIAIGTPAHAGVYQATAVSFETKNYEAGKGTGSLVILKNWKGIKLVKNPLFDASNNEITGKNNTITVSQAEKIAKSVCILSDSEGSLNDSAQSAVHYWFTGVNKIYAKSAMPTAPGKYIVTASVRGGDFFAFPKTFSFTIVAD